MAAGYRSGKTREFALALHGRAAPFQIARRYDKSSENRATKNTVGVELRLQLIRNILQRSIDRLHHRRLNVGPLSAKRIGQFAKNANRAATMNERINTI